MRVRWFDLRFSGPSAPLEQPFREHEARESIGHVRFASLLGAVLFAVFGFLDAMLLPESHGAIWAIRFGLLVPAALSTFLATWTSWFLRWMQPFLATLIVLSGAGITAMVVLVPPPVNYSYYAGNILVIVFGYTFLRLRFLWASLAGWVVVGLYQVAALGLSETPLEILANNNFFFVSANFIGMVACYAMEFYARRDYFMVHALSEERARVVAARDELEIRVAERTLALTLANRELETEVDQRRHAETEREALEAQLAQAQRMEAIGNLASGVAHDLNNLLSGLVGWPEVVLMELEPDSPHVEPLETIKRSGEMAAAVVQDLLTLARRGAQVKDGVDLSRLVEAEVRSPSFRKLSESHPHVELKTELAPDLLPVLGSPVHLAKAIANLIGNAVEANLVDGQVTVSTQNRFLEEPLQGFETVPPGEYAVLTVSDSGVGISEEDLPKIFEPFYTKKRMGRSGTGLGMTVVWATVKDHDGYLDVRSMEGEGTRFEVFLPITRVELAEARSRPTLEDLQGSERILVVDDLESQREIAAKMLGKLGYQVFQAEGGEAALEWLEEHDADLVILDMVMDPGIDGCDTYRRMLELRGAQRAIIASGYSENDRVREVQVLGAGPYVKKPYTMERLASAVRRGLEG